MRGNRIPPSTTVTKEQALTILRACRIYGEFNFPRKAGESVIIAAAAERWAVQGWKIARVEKVPEKSTYGKPLYRIHFES